MIQNTSLHVSVIIPVYQGGEQFRLCLESIDRTSPQPDELIIVADGARNDPAQIRERPHIQFICTGKRAGPARARNVGAHQASGEILLFLDADVQVPPDIVHRVQEAFRRHPSLTAVIGSYDDVPAETNFLSQYRNLFHHFVHQTAHEEASTFWGACGAIRRKAFWACGGFNDGYTRPSIEDIEFGYRIRAMGGRIRLLKNLQVKHLKHWSLVNMLKTDLTQRAFPWTMLILRKRGWINDLNLKGASRISVVLTFCLLLLGGATVFSTTLVIPLVGISCALVWLNRDVYRFFRKKKGLVFSLTVVPWHWFYYFYSGLGFILGLAYFSARMIASRLKQKRFAN